MEFSLHHFLCNPFCNVLKVLQMDKRTEKLSDQLRLFTPMHTCVYAWDIINTLLYVLYVCIN